MRRRALYQRALISTALPRRGVTTQSPTFASIHVSWYPSSPSRRSPSVRIDCNAEARAANVMIDDIDELRQKLRQRVAVTGHAEISSQWHERYQRVASAVWYKTFVLTFRKHVGNQPIADVISECSKDIAGLQVPAGGQCQSFKADHGVAAPIREPMVAGYHGANFVACGLRSRRIRDARTRRNDELVGGKEQFCRPAACISGRAMSISLRRRLSSRSMASAGSRAKNFSQGSVDATTVNVSPGLNAVCEISGSSRVRRGIHSRGFVQRDRKSS